jgi:hypothetical protein
MIKMALPFKFTFFTPDGARPNIEFTAEINISRDAYTVMWIDPDNKELCHVQYTVATAENAVGRGFWKVHKVLCEGWGN